MEDTCPGTRILYTDEPDERERDENPTGRRQKRHTKQPTPQKQTTQELILEFLQTYAPQSISNALCMDQWLKDKRLENITGDDKFLLNAIDILQRQILSYDLIKFSTMFSNKSVFSNKRVLYWDEPNFEPAAIETLKMLLAGDKCPANIKYKDHQIINKTPVIITTNFDP